MSGSVKFYALCCRNTETLKRHIETIPKEDLVVIINTQDSDFETAAVSWCTSESIEHYVTVSDGTAATGKNSVFDKFAESDNDYMVLVDGDDYITGHGVWTYKQIASLSTPPDVLALEYQIGIHNSTGYDPLNCGLVDFPTIGDNTDPRTIPGTVIRPFKFPAEWWTTARAGEQVKVTPDDPDLFAATLNDVHQRWSNHCYDYINGWEVHCRMVFFSKAAVNTGLRFDPVHIVGEDTVLYFEYKHLHNQGSLVMKHLFDRYPTYVYDTRIGGVVEAEKDKNGHDVGWLNWLTILTNKYDELEAAGKMHTERLPELKVFTVPESEEQVFNASDWDIVWPEGYIPDVDNLVNYPGISKIKL
jgi:hypothetical protein